MGYKKKLMMTGFGDFTNSDPNMQVQMPDTTEGNLGEQQPFPTAVLCSSGSPSRNDQQQLSKHREKSVKNLVNVYAKPLEEERYNVLKTKN